MCFVVVELNTYLVGPEATSNWGRVEIDNEGVRSTLCDKYIDEAEVDLICKQHGYSGGSKMGTADLDVDENFPILLTSPDCRGNETSLAQCVSFNLTSVSVRSWCNHDQDLYVLCHNQGMHQLALFEFLHKMTLY